MLKWTCHFLNIWLSLLSDSEDFVLVLSIRPNFSIQVTSLMVNSELAFNLFGFLGIMGQWEATRLLFGLPILRSRGNLELLHFIFVCFSAQRHGPRVKDAVCAILHQVVVSICSTMANHSWSVGKQHLFQHGRLLEIR
jgi:hypothetical protein